MRDKLNSGLMSKQNIAASVLRLRKREGWSQAELGRRIGMSRSQIGKIERAETDTSASAIQAFADEFQVPIGEITGERPGDRRQLNDETDDLMRLFALMTGHERRSLLVWLESMYGVRRGGPDTPPAAPEKGSKKR